MTPPKKGFKTTDEYIASFPQNIQATLQQVRQAIKDVAPQAQEVISYSMPAFKQKGILVWFAAFKNHIGFFPKVSAMEAFKEQLVRLPNKQRHNQVSSGQTNANWAYQGNREVPSQRRPK